MSMPLLVLPTIKLSSHETAVRDAHSELRLENTYLRKRVEVLQGEVWDLSGRLARALQLSSASSVGGGRFLF